MHTVRIAQSYFDFAAVWIDDPMEISFDGCYFLGNPGGAAGGALPYNETANACPGGSPEHCYASTCCSQPRSPHDPAACMECHGAFITLAATKAGVAASKGEVFGFSLTNSFFDWGPEWYATGSPGRVAVAINETQGKFNRSRIVSTRMEHNTFTGVQGAATKLTRQLHLTTATLWRFDICDGILFPAAKAGELERSGAGSAGSAGSAERIAHHVDYSIQIEDSSDAAGFARHKLGAIKGCIVEVCLRVCLFNADADDPDNPLY